MNQILIALIVLALVGVGVALYYWKGARKARELQLSLSLNKNLEKLIHQDQYEYYLVDVRSEAEYARGHIPTAINVPYSHLSSYLPSDNLFSNIIVYGRSPMQSSKASHILANSGYFNVTSFGPIFRWRGEIDESLKETK